MLDTSQLKFSAKLFFAATLSAMSIGAKADWVLLQRLQLADAYFMPSRLEVDGEYRSVPYLLNLKPTIFSKSQRSALYIKAFNCKTREHKMVWGGLYSEHFAMGATIKEGAPIADSKWESAEQSEFERITLVIVCSAPTPRNKKQ